MIKQSDIQNLFFLGIGGIGMSALARYYHHLGYTVAGYDRTPSPLTKELETEGIPVTYDDDTSFLLSFIPSLVKEHTLVVRTPAVPEDSVLYTYLREQGYTIMKRAEVLGMVTRSMKALCVPKLKFSHSNALEFQFKNYTQPPSFTKVEGIEIKDNILKYSVEDFRLKKKNIYHY